MRIKNLRLWQFHFAVFLSLAPTAHQYEFDKNYVGVVFTPNGKLLENGNYPPGNDYSLHEVQELLSVVSTRFKNIATYSMGVNKVDAKSWDEGDAVGLTGIAAARLNEQNNKTLIRVNLGVHQYGDLKQETEIKIALKVAKEANAIHAGTVWGITVTSNFINDFPTSRKVIELINDAKTLAEADGENVNIQIGTRVNNCDNLTLVNGNVSFLIDVIKNVDYVLCLKMPMGSAVRSSMKHAVFNILGDTFIQTKITMHRINPNVSVIFETGWASQGVSKYGLPTSIDYLRNYWKEMGTWAKANTFPLHMFEALDQPWKSHATDEQAEFQDRENPLGICGSESHFGWWRRTDNHKDDATAYVEKITEPQRPACDEMETFLTSNLVLGFSLAAGVIVLLIVTVLILYWRLRTTKDELLTDKEIEEFESGIGEFVEGGESHDIPQALPYDRKFELGEDKFSVDRTRILGSGAFGIVYKGKIEGHKTAAFKTIKQRCPAESLKSLLAEIKLMIYIGTHPNIVCLLGSYTGGIREGVVYIACEYCAHGSLDKVLQNIAGNTRAESLENLVPEKNMYANKQVTFERYVNTPKLPPTYLRPESVIDESVMDFKLSILLKWASQIANGMAHLVSKKVIHADLAARNVLLTGDGTAKITDFGLSRKLYAYTEYVKQNEEPLPWRWMAMESLKKLTFSAESDVWSFGVTIWEIFTLGDVPYPGLAWEIGFIDRLMSGLRLQKPKYASPEIYEMMVKCWKPVPKERPNFDELTVFFKELIGAPNCIDNDKC